MSNTVRPGKGTVLCLAVVLLASAACGRESDPTVSAQEASVTEFAQSLAPCDGEIDGPDAASFLTIPGAWFRLSAAVATVAEDDSLPSTIEVDAEYVGGDAEVEDLARALEPSGRLLATAAEAELVERSVDSGFETYVKAEAVGSDLLVIFPLAFNESGDFAFVGNCRAERYSAPLTAEYGARAREVVRSLVGTDVTGTQRVLGLDTPTSPPPTAEVPPLNPEFTDPEVLQTLTVGDFVLAPVPESWIGPYTLCPKIDEGWSPCFDLSNPATHGQPALLYFNPERPTIEFWLADESADLTQPISLIGSIDVSEQVAEVQRFGLGQVTVTLSLSPDSSIESAVAGAVPSQNGSLTADVVTD